MPRVCEARSAGRKGGMVGHGWAWLDVQVSGASARMRRTSSELLLGQSRRSAPAARRTMRTKRNSEQKCWDLRAPLAEPRSVRGNYTGRRMRRKTAVQRGVHITRTRTPHTNTVEIRESGAGSDGNSGFLLREPRKPSPVFAVMRARWRAARDEERNMK